MDKPPPANILLVDDRPERLLTLETILESLNQTLISVTSGEDALREVLKRDFAVILLDVHMPGMSGFEVAQIIRQRASSSHTPIVFVTGSHEWEDMERAYAMGAVDFIPVPLNAYVLRAKVSVFVDLYQAAQRARLEAEARTREEEARKRAEAESRAKDDFLATVSHELRTPLTPILATIQTLEHDHDPQTLRHALHMMRRNLELEARLIDDLLDLTRIRTGKLHLQIETVNVHNALTRAVEICEQKAREKKVALSCNSAAEEYFVEGDAARFQQVFWNLISNAIKFTPPGGGVSVQTRNPAPTEIEITVTDTGIGIDPHDLRRVFDRFMQFSRGLAPQGGTGGLGLGLAISKSLVEALGGKIWAWSAGANRGATLTVLLHTTTQRPAETVDSPEGGKPSPKSMRILLVDDHQDTREALQKLLIRKGYLVEAASDVSSALEMAHAHSFDLLISDIGLPDGSGVDLMRKLQECRPIPGIALSGFGMEHDIARSKEAGFIEHLTKPVNFSQLQAVILEHVAG